MMNRSNTESWRLSMIILTALAWLTTSGALGAVEYEDYKSNKTQTDYFSVTVNGDRITLSVFDEDRTVMTVTERDKIVIESNRVLFADGTALEEDALVMDGVRYPYNAIHTSEVFGMDGKTEIRFTRRTDGGTESGRTRRGNLISFSDKIIVDQDQFIRGSVIGIVGDLEIYGEINQDVIALFGEVYIGAGAVIRGDVASLTGRTEFARDASISGEVYAEDEKKFGRRRKFKRRNNTLSISGDFFYNRVDGAIPEFTARYDDVDSLLPSLWASAGYGFASDRWRYEFGIEQTLWRAGRLGIGAKLYRRLASDDDWLLTDDENVVFTLFVTEDFKDYYEAEGGSVYLNFSPWRQLSFEAAYTQDETKWLDAHPHLWSLFGGDKLFSDNFGRVSQAFRDASVLEIDSTTNAYLSAELSLDTREEDEGYNNSSWIASTSFEWSDDNIRSDFDYRRYQVRATRYQKVNQRAMLMLSGTAGFSDGYLPMYKRYYLGGLGTLRGFYHKEFMGSRFWMANAAYKVEIPQSELGLSVFWDGGQIANDTKLTSDIEVKQNVGFGVYFDTDFKITVSKRLDRSTNDDPKIYVRFHNVF